MSLKFIIYSSNCVLSCLCLCLNRPDPNYYSINEKSFIVRTVTHVWLFTFLTLILTDVPSRCMEPVRVTSLGQRQAWWKSKIMCCKLNNIFNHILRFMLNWCWCQLSEGSSLVGGLLKCFLFDEWRAIGSSLHVLKVCLCLYTITPLTL